ncbi:NADH-quinone oxidoreductase subunit G [Auraticoccus monumenti]|uniref:NADH-quinone oxidoreductase n=1 Tax=Auraticoccus monumenti TaxID=675864 RepID=A0A1G6WU92_9ACTN|nr:NADH-quinone oxidoreductase subunit G [Auraticoccus monumenti]SDD69510.1 NADH-quinone oxidoreductase subunit G [Auraticoccus monumenti]
MSVTDRTGAGAELEQRDDLVTLTIDDTQVSVPKGTLAIRAAELIGVAIPRFCDHPLLDPVGACRQCLVEVPDAGNGRGMPKPQASCTLEVAEGMQIRTQVTSPVADKAQHGMIEMLLLNHPLDCPVCDKGGECPLQNQAMSNGRGESRFEAVKRTYPKPVSISAQVLLDRERCVLCARCTRFSEQVAGDPFIALVERGALQQVGIYEREPFESYFSGNTIQICPVGALTSAAYRFRARPFDLTSTPSVSEHDSCGSAIRVDHRRGEVMRRLAGDDPEVNEEWITDKDRFAFRYGRGEDRVRTPLVREGDVLRPASWPEAIDVAVRGLQAAAGSVGVLTGGRLTLEDAYGYSRFARTVLGTNDIDFRSRPHSAEEAEFLASHVAGRADVVTADLEQASGVLMVAFEPEEEAGTIFLRLRKGMRKHGLRSWTLAPYLSNGARKMGAALVPTVPGTEAQVLDGLERALELDADSVVLVGERAATSPGTLTAVAALVQRTGARLAWVPRRAGDRGAVEAGCLPGLLPGGRPLADARARVDCLSVWELGRELPATPGRDTGQMLAAAATGGLRALVVAGVEPADLADPAAARRGLEQVGFLVSVEQRLSEVTERADVVLPVSLVEERPGTFVTWEGRRREFGVVIRQANPMTDLRVLAALSDALGHDLGIRTVADARRELAQLDPWTGARPAAPAPAPATAAAPAPAGATGARRAHGAVAMTADGGPTRTGADHRLTLATWRMMLDPSRALDGEPHLLATARRPVARVSEATARRTGLVEGGGVRLHGATGSAVLPVHVTPQMVDGVVWVPTLAAGVSVNALGLSAGAPVVVSPTELPASPEPGARVPVGEGALPEVDGQHEEQGGVA